MEVMENMLPASSARHLLKKSQGFDTPTAPAVIMFFSSGVAIIGPNVCPSDS